MTEYRKQQIIVGMLGTTLNSLLPAFIMQSEMCEGREISPEESDKMAQEVYEYADKLLMEEGASV